MIKTQPSTRLQAVFLNRASAFNVVNAQNLCLAKQKTLICISPTMAPSKKRASLPPCRAADPSTSSSDSVDTEDDRFQVEIPTSEAQSALKFSAVRVGGGKAIIIEAVAIGSEAEEAGIRPGQQLLSLSDPIRPQERWTLNDRASLRYIRDAVRMRRAPFIMLELSLTPLREWQDDNEGAVYTSESDSNESETVGEEQDLLSAVAAEAAANLSPISSLDSMDLPGSTAPGTIGERLQRNYNKSNTGMTDVERRVEKRKEYFEQSSNRNDAPFFAAVLAAFLLPAFIILGIASSSGYLDALAAGWAGR